MNRKLNVYLHGKKTGELFEGENAQLSFKYQPDAKEPLSVRLPVQKNEYTNDYAFPFFENLTPEGRPLEIMAARMQISENNPFSILERIGGDCAGAVSLYEGKLPDKTEEPLREITEKEMARIINELPENPLLTGMDNPPRLSLAGAQSKFAVYMEDEKRYFCPNDDYPSTQIIKIESGTYKNLLHNELFCMMLGQSCFRENLGLTIPQVKLCKADRKQFLNITRYDRYVSADKQKRIHQEDFCQALGFPSGKKYQADGGPGIRNCYKAIIQYSSDKIPDSFSFLQWVAFNFLIGNADAHAKNLSLLHKDGEIRLAPFYDLLSTEIYAEKLATRKTAMLINGKDRYEKIRKKDFLELYKQLDLNPLQVMKNLSLFFAETSENAQALRGRLNSNKLTASPVYDEIIDIIKKRLPVFAS